MNSGQRETMYRAKMMEKVKDPEFIKRVRKIRLKNKKAKHLNKKSKR